MSEVKVNKISPRTDCGTVTLGDSGDSFVIPAGATIAMVSPFCKYGGVIRCDLTLEIESVFSCASTVINTNSSAKKAILFFICCFFLVFKFCHISWF